MENRLAGYFMYLHTPPNPKDLESLAKDIEAATTYEWAEDILQKLPPPQKGVGFTFVDRALWLLRWAYIHGYRAGINAESNIAAIREAQNKRLERLVCHLILHEGKGNGVLAVLEKYVLPGTKKYTDMPFADCCELETALNQLRKEAQSI